MYGSVAPKVDRVVSLFLKKKSRKTSFPEKKEEFSGNESFGIFFLRNSDTTGGSELEALYSENIK